MLSITYIHHDCFVLNFKSRCTLVFDYWKDPMCAGLKDTPDFIRDLDDSMPCYIFVSHHHKDHLNKIIFEWAAEHDNIFFILSADTAKFVRHILKPDSIWNGYKVPDSRYSVLKNGESFSDGIIDVQAFGSTDVGNSYMVTVDGVSVFHAGDLNAWIWKDESTNEEVEEALNSFKRILHTIRDRFPRVDVAMFPVDSRIGTDYWTGANEWLKGVKTVFFFPMHFALADSPDQGLQRKRDASRFDSYLPEESTTICAALCERGDRLIIPPERL